MEGTVVESFLDLEELDPNLFRSKTLWRPLGGIGVFGGQVVGQSLVAATKTVKAEYEVHSLHSYFLIPGDTSIPIIYSVERVRDGNSFATRIVEARQRGKPIFSCLISFHKREDGPIEHQYKMPDVPPPESLPSDRDVLKGMLDDPNVPKKFHKFISPAISQPFAIDIRRTQPVKDLMKASEPRQMAWMKANGTLGDDPALHRCVAAFASDNLLLSTAVLSAGLYFSHPRLKMMASLDHSIWFHAPNFRVDDWMLYEMESPRAKGNRGFTLGRLYARDGTLIMSCAQEGIIRVTPEGAPRSKSKL